MTNPNARLEAYLRYYGVSPEQAPAETEEDQEARRVQEQINQLLNPGAARAEIAGRENDVGIESSNEVQNDFRNLTAIQLEQKYGAAQARRMISARNRGITAYRAGENMDRTPNEAISDTSIGLVQGAVNGLGGLADLALSPVSPGTAVEVSRGLGRFNQDMEGSKSLPLREGRLNNELIRGQQSRDSDLRYEMEKDDSSGILNSLARFGSDFMNTEGIVGRAESDRLDAGTTAGIAKLRQVGRDVVNTGGTVLSDPETTMDVVANAGGSLLSGSVVGKALRTGAPFLGARGSMTASIAAQEAGGAYQQTAQEAYELLENRTDLSQEQKYMLANEAAQTAAATQAPIAAVTGMVVARFEANPLAFSSARRALGNTVKETGEEAFQSGSANLAVNNAIQRYIDPTRELTQGLGDEIALGAVGGMGAGAATSTPGVVAESSAKALVGAGRAGYTLARTVAKGGGSALSLAGSLTQSAFEAAKPTVEAVINRRQNIDEQNRKASPVSREKTSAALEDAMIFSLDTLNNLEGTLEESGLEGEARSKAADYLISLAQAVSSSADTLDENAPDSVRNALETANNRLEAIENLVSVLENAEPESFEQKAAAVELLRARQQVLDLTDNMAVPEIGAMDDSSAAKSSAIVLFDALQSLRSNKEFKNATTKAEQVLNTAKSPQDLTAVETVETPEGRVNVAAAVSLAENSPALANPDTNRVILEHAEQGKVELTGSQRAALLASSALIQAERFRLAAIEEGQVKPRDLVSAEVLTERASGEATNKKSLAGFLKEILSAYRAGDTPAAAATLEELMLFAQHFQNKLAAINEHYAQGGTGKGVVYKALTPRGRIFKDSVDPAYVRPSSKTSVLNAQTVASEAAMLAQVANQLAEIFGDLGVEPVEAVSLVPELQGNAEEIAKREGAKKRSENAKAQREKLKAEKTPQEPETKTSEAEVREESVAPATEAETQVTEQQEDPELQKLRDELAAKEARIAELETAQEQAPEPVVEPASEPVVEEAPAEVEPEIVPEPAPEPAEEVSEAPAPETPDVQEEPVEASEEVLTTEAEETELFPNLVGENNRFKRAFTVPASDEQQTSNILGNSRPIEYVRDALEVSDDGATPEIVSAYSNYLGIAQSLVARAEKRLQGFLKKPATKTTKETNGERLLKDGKLLGFERGRALNIVNNVDGKLSYDPGLVEAAALAALQWVQRVDQFEVEKDMETVASILGLSLEDAQDLAGAREEALIEAFNSGLTPVEASRSLANIVRRYWGMKSNPEAALADVEGIPEAVAKEMLASMIDLGIIQVREPVKEVFDGKSPLENGRSPLVLVVGVNEEQAILDKAPDLIERTVARNPARATFVGAPPQEVAKTQLHNSRVQLTREQQNAIRQRQNTPFKLNSLTLNFFNALGLSGVQALFAGGEIDETKLNVVHQRSLEGRNTTFESQFQTMQQVASEITQTAETSGQAKADVPVYYQYSFNVMNRQQMLGKNTPQSSKLVREVLLPTRATVDLSRLNSEAFTGFLLAVGQHLGEKVELGAPNEIAGKILTSLGRDYQGSIAGLQSWLQDGGEISPELIETLKAELGGDNTPAAVHGLLEYARWLGSSPEERAAFETSLYLEADGKTNGPVNAMALFSVGEFTVDWLENMERGGMFVGAPKAMHENQAGDLYEASSTKLQNLMDSLLRSASPEVAGQIQNLMGLLSLFMGKDVTFDETGIHFKRGISKNPLTVTLYGSADKGIANKITKALAVAIGERMSDAMARQAENPALSQAEAMFPNSADPELEWNSFLGALEELTNKEASDTADGIDIQQIRNEGIGKLSFRDFAIEGTEFKAIQQNMKVLLVGPMQQAIEATVGSSMMGTLQRIRMATQVQSIVMARIFRKKIEERIAARKDDGSYSRNDFLSRKELDEIFREMGDLNPILSTGGQNFLIANSNSGDVAETEFSATLTGKLRTPGFVEGFKDAGVRGIPSLVIGSGDGTMMQKFSSMFAEGTSRTLDVFDGINLPLDALQKYSRQINQAVSESWNNNPLRGVSETFSGFLENAPLKEMTEQDRKDLTRALFGEFGKARPVAEIRAALEELETDLAKGAMQVEARQKALARVNLSVDQMAGVAAPYVQSGKIPLSGLSNAQKAQVLNEIYLEELAKLQERKAEESKAEVQIPSDIRVMLEKTGASAQQKSILKDLFTSVADRGYQIISGTEDQVRAELAKRGIPAPVAAADRKVNGYTLPAERLVVLINPSAETLVHEVIHAATFDAVAAYYSGTTGSNTVEQARAVERIEALMQQFLEMGGDESFDLAISEHQKAYRAAVARNKKKQAEKDRVILGALKEKGVEPKAIDEQALVSRFEQYGISDEVALGFKDYLVFTLANGRRQVADGQFKRKRGLENKFWITISRATQRPENEIVDHEVIHALRMLGLFTDSEWATLVSLAKSDSEIAASVERKYAHLPEDKRHEEMVADYFAAWRAGKVTVAANGKGLLEKMRQFLRDIASLLRGVNPPGSTEQIMNKIVSGEIGSRKRGITKEDGLFTSLAISEDAQTGYAYANAREAITRHLKAGNKAAALNEFMAWGLANQELSGLLGKTKASPLARLGQKVIAGIRKLIFGDRKMTPVMSDMLSNLRFNTTILANAEIDFRADFNDTVLFHSETYGNSQRLARLNEAISRKIVSKLNEDFRHFGDAARSRVVESKIKDMLASTDLLVGMVGAVFPMDMQQKTTFQILMAVMQSTVALDETAMLKAGALYEHFTKVGNVETFMRDPDAGDMIDRYQAQEKWNLLIGNMDVEFDEQGRSSLLPVFLALSMIHPRMREALRSLPLPQAERNQDGTLDARLDNAGAAIMDMLENKLAGVQGNEANVQEVMDALAEQIIKTAEERKGFFSLTMDRVGSGIDRVNDTVAQGMEAAAEFGFREAGKVVDSTNNPLVKATAQGVRALSGIANRRIGNELAEEAIASVNRVPQLPKVFSDLVNDVVGRTKNNAPIYDLIKRVRNWVQQRRQEFREHLPELIAEQFSRELTDQEWRDMFHGIAKTDMAALRDRYTMNEILALVKNPSGISAEITKLEAELQQLNPTGFALLKSKAEQLAEFMNTGLPGANLLRNARAISKLLGERAPAKYFEAGGQVQVIDTLTSLYAMEGLSQSVRESLSNLAATEEQGLKFVTAYLEGQRKEELRKSTGMAFYNAYKGFIPSEQTVEGSLIVANDEAFTDLAERSYVRVGDYEGSDLERGSTKRGYYYAPVNARASYQQGILQTVQQTAGGVDLISGLTHGKTTSGAIQDAASVARAWRGRGRESGKELLLPVYDGNGEIVAYERSVHPEQLQMLELDQHLGRTMGVWRGRQVEEAEGRQVNQMLIQRLKDMFDQDVRSSSSKRAEYVNLFDSKELKKDAVLADMMTSMPGHTLADISAIFGDEFMVRRDMLNDALGYRDASVRNFWDGQSRIDPRVLKAGQDLVKQVFGNKAFQYAVKAEDFLKNVITDLRVLVVVKSVVVPAANLTWNVLQLATRGVPLNAIRKGFPRKVAEINEYLKTRERLIDAEAELRAAGADVIRIRKIEAEIQEIRDRHRRLSIWPLIEAGELTSISDGMLSKDDLSLSEGRLSEYFEKIVERLPQKAQTAARYGIVARDTALFRGLQKAIEYGDFLGKAVLYDDLIGRQGKSQDDALAAVTEEFVNYDRLPGRSRGYLEQIGLLWFWHFKLRSTKVAVSMIRNNPVHALITMNAPIPDFFGPAGSPITDNAASVIADGRAGYSVGFGMGMRAPQLNPWWALMN